MRENGCDGEISCMIKTEDLTENKSVVNAVQFEDYLPLHEKICFEHGETEKVVSIQLMANIDAVQVNKHHDTLGDDDEEDEVADKHDLMFKVFLINASPEGVKISKKNVCIVHIS